MFRNPNQYAYGFFWWVDFFLYNIHFTWTDSLRALICEFGMPVSG